MPQIILRSDDSPLELSRAALPLQVVRGLQTTPVPRRGISSNFGQVIAIIQGCFGSGCFRVEFAGQFVLVLCSCFTARYTSSKSARPAGRKRHAPKIPLIGA